MKFITLYFNLAEKSLLARKTITFIAIITLLHVDTDVDQLLKLFKCVYNRNLHHTFQIHL